MMSPPPPIPEGSRVRVVTDAEVVRLLHAAVAEAGSRRAYARSTGLHHSDLCQTLRGRAAPSERQCHAVGVEWALVVRDEAPAAGEGASCR